MNCHLEDQLSAYMDDELNEEQRQQVEAHLENCESCQVLLEELLSLQSSVITNFSRVEAPADLEIRVAQAIANRPKPAVAEKRWLFLPFTALLALGIFWFITASVLGKFIHVFIKLMIALVYTGSHLISNVPVLSGLTIVLSVLIISASVYSLRRLLQTSPS